MSRAFSRSLLAAALALGSSPAWAASATGSIQASATLNSDCTLSANPMSFGTVSALRTTNVDVSSSMTVTCTSNTAYNLGVSTNTFTAGFNEQMTLYSAVGGGAPELMPYSVTQDSAGAVLWGNTIGTDTIAGTGSGASQTINVYGHLKANQNNHTAQNYSVPDVGSYNDTLTITLSY